MSEIDWLLPEGEMWLKLPSSLRLSWQQFNHAVSLKIFLVRCRNMTTFYFSKPFSYGSSFRNRSLNKWQQKAKKKKIIICLVNMVKRLFFLLVHKGFSVNKRLNHIKTMCVGPHLRSMINLPYIVFLQQYINLFETIDFNHYDVNQWSYCKRDHKQMICIKLTAGLCLDLRPYWKVYS